MTEHPNNRRTGTWAAIIHEGLPSCLENTAKLPNIVAHACNPNYSGGRDQQITVQSQSRQKFHKTPSQPI
jgi:hypothetical protein